MSHFDYSKRFDNLGGTSGGTWKMEHGTCVRPEISHVGDDG